MPRRNKIGDWECVERDEGYERWEHPSYTTVTLRYDASAPPGERWTWTTSKKQGRATRNGDAFSAALMAAGAKGPSGMSRPGRPPANSPGAVLRAALSGPFPAIQQAAEAVVRQTLSQHSSTGDRAAALGLPLSTYHALRADFPSVFADPEDLSPGDK